MGFMALFFSAYLYLLKNPYFSVTYMPLTSIDEWIGFQPQYLYFYLSLWVYVSLAPALMKTRNELFHYGLYIGIVCLIGIAIYIVFPTTIPQIAIEWSRYPDFQTLKSVDTAGNAFPSLHVATAFFTVFWLDYHLQQMNAHPSIRWFNGIWCLGIVYSTMAIKQHVFFDVAGGLMLGGVLAIATLRYHRRRFALFGSV